MKILTSLFIVIFTGLLIACSSDDSGTNANGSTGTLSVQITDAPVDNADAVVIHFTRASIKPDGADVIEEDVTDPLTNDPGRSIDLLQFTGDKSTALFDKELPAGSYSWIRLEVDFDPLKTYIDVGGQHFPLVCNSCEKNGLKLNRSFTVSADNTMAFTLDFDLRKSITEANGDYKLRPTVRVIETIAAGMIHGTVDSTLISSLGGAEDCVVYIFEGSDVTPNDIIIPEPGNFNNPTSTTPVELNASSIYEYTAAFLTEGEYTASLTCDAELDDPLVDNTGSVNFSGTTNATVSAGSITTVDFPAP